MARKGRPAGADGEGTQDYRHAGARRKNNPPAGIAPTYETREHQSTRYTYDPHLDPQLQWAGKAEHTSFDVDVVSLHIHERISTSAILRAVRRPEPIQFDLFGETPLPADKEVEFYQHEVDWANRLILGDSLLVMNSLLVKEGMAGKVQMIYMDPPYGIKYASNFQPRLDRRDVKDQDEDLTHEPEQIKAYRDTWKLGIHSYLTYLRDRLLLARELLTESGSIFVQINDENLHLVRCLLDEVFGRENFVAVIPFRKKTMPLGTKTIEQMDDFLLWYAKNGEEVKYRQLFAEQSTEGDILYKFHELTDFSRQQMSAQQIRNYALLPNRARPFRLKSLMPSGPNQSGMFSFEYRGKQVNPPKNGWSTDEKGMIRLAQAERLEFSGESLNYVLFGDDYPVTALTAPWQDTTGPSERIFAVQTGEKVIERCILMTTDPGDLVFDPTCVRKGARVWRVDSPPVVPPQAGGLSAVVSLSQSPCGQNVSPPQSPRRRGEESFSLSVYGEGRGGAFSLPACGEGRGGASLLPIASLVPIEAIQPGDWVLAHDGKPHRVLRVIRRQFKGRMVGIRHARSETMLWLTDDHRVLAKTRPRTLGGNCDWSGIPEPLRGRSQELRCEMSPPERKLWARLRNDQLGFSFRRQHPIGRYIADFYSREARLVVEVDGLEAHSGEDAVAHDTARDEYLQSLGLQTLRIPASEVERNLDGVCEFIRWTCEKQMCSEDAEWVEAGELAVGDIVFFGPDRQGVPIVEIRSETTAEEVYDLEVEDAHSFITEVCAVHNCGSGTTAYCAEKWGRRWITCDTSRVALAIARQRLMTAKFDYYELKDPERGPAGGFIYETVPHITLESIAQNTEIDAIAEQYQPQIEQALAELNRALGTGWKEWEVPREVPHPLWSEAAQQAYWRLLEIRNRLEPEAQKEAEGLLETIYQQTGHRWKLNEVPAPVPADNWSEPAKTALRRFWELKRQKRQEIDASIQRNAPQETLYDRPKMVRGVVRVSGPFTVEAIPVPAVEDPSQMPIPQFEDTEEADLLSAQRTRVNDRGGDHLTTMLNLLKQQGGVLFPGGKRLELQNLRPLTLGYLHAEAESTPPQPSPQAEPERRLRVAISFGPRHGPVIAHQVQEAIQTALVNGYDILIFAGFAFDPEAQALIQKVPVARLQVHFANISPDVLVGDLLKTTRASQIFTVFGQPDVAVHPQTDGTFVVELRGVDTYDPLTGEVNSVRGEEVAAWFLDTDYDGKTFHICQAFFPGDPDAWEKLQRALKAQIDPEAFEHMRGTVSFPFQPGDHRRIAVKVIDFRGNEVVRVTDLRGGLYAR